MVKLLKLPITTAVDSGTTTATSTGQIVDSGQNFETTVRIGDKVTMTVSGETALVTKVEDDDTLDISADIAVSGEAFTISRIDHLFAPVGEGILCDIVTKPNWTNMRLPSKISMTGTPSPTHVDHLGDEHGAGANSQRVRVLSRIVFRIDDLPSRRQA